jgi:hypothetical protein
MVAALLYRAALKKIKGVAREVRNFYWKKSFDSANVRPSLEL